MPILHTIGENIHLNLLDLSYKAIKLIFRIIRISPKLCMLKGDDFR